MTSGRRLGAALFLTGACTVPNPDYVPDAGDCPLGERRCIKSLEGDFFPVVCTQTDGGGGLLVREPCPAQAACKAGRCAAPDGAQGCSRQRDCGAGEVCVPLLSGAQVASFCLPAQVGLLQPGARCQRDAECQSLLCLQHKSGKFCLKACKDDSDCGIPNVCGPFRVTVSGIQAMIGSCTQP